MQLNTYLKGLFAFNCTANLQLMEKVGGMPDQAEAIRLLSHLVNCQIKWLARIRQEPGAAALDWWQPLYTLAELPGKWKDSCDVWMDFLDHHDDSFLGAEVVYEGWEGRPLAATPQDMAQQLIFHSVHHRAQIQTMLREQGIEPDFVDYIGTRTRAVS